MNSPAAPSPSNNSFKVKAKFNFVGSVSMVIFNEQILLNICVALFGYSCKSICLSKGYTVHYLEV